jgi:hypothetical protein
MANRMTPKRVKAARAVAVIADAVQLGLLPLFVGGWVSPLNDALDVAVAIAMVVLVGWHWAFLPAFVAELVPIWGLVPTWTAAVLIATRNAPSVEPAPAGAGPVIDVTATPGPPAAPRELPK